MNRYPAKRNQNLPRHLAPLGIGGESRPAPNMPVSLSGPLSAFVVIRKMEVSLFTLTEHGIN